MIKGFKHKGLKALFEGGKTSKIGRNYVSKSTMILDTLDAATRPEDMAIPGFDFHPLRGKPKTWSCHVNGNYCITFEWDEGPYQVDFKDYH